MKAVGISIGSYSFIARWEYERSPRTSAAFQQLLPFTGDLVHARWSGEAAWVPLGAFDLRVGSENPVNTPGPGEILFYPGGISETEILIPYGTSRFSSVAGPLSGNHFLTIIEGKKDLEALGRHLLWRGSQRIRIERSD